MKTLTFTTPERSLSCILAKTHQNFPRNRRRQSIRTVTVTFNPALGFAPLTPRQNPNTPLELTLIL